MWKGYNEALICSKAVQSILLTDVYGTIGKTHKMSL